MFCQRCGKSVGPTAAYSRHCCAPVVSADDADVVITAATTAPSDAPCETRSPVTSAPSTASSTEGAALRSEIGRLEAALSDAAAEHASASEASGAEGAALRSEIGQLEAALSDAAVEQQERMRAEQDAQLHALQESAAASLTVSEASGAEGAALRSEIGRLQLEAALSDAASEHAAAIEASATEGAALRSEIGRLEAVLSEAAASMYPATQWQ